jgi:hypothetical protein
VVEIHLFAILGALVVYTMKVCNSVVSISRVINGVHVLVTLPTLEAIQQLPEPIEHPHISTVVLAIDLLTTEPEQRYEVSESVVLPVSRTAS